MGLGEAPVRLFENCIHIVPCWSEGDALSFLGLAPPIASPPSTNSKVINSKVILYPEVPGAELHNNP